MNKHKFNIIDAAVVIVIIGIIAAGIWFFWSSGDGADINAYFVVEIRDQMPNFFDTIEIGGEIRDSIRNYFLGHVVDAHYQPATMVSFDYMTESFILTVIPERYDVYITIRGTGTENNSVITSNGQAVRVGQEMFLRGTGYAGIGFITELWTEAR